MEKVIEPTIEETWECPRCRQDYCGECVDKCKVDFDIEDKPEGFHQRKVQWKDLLVCPYCYNQLIDLN